jgi:heme-degrading monooxygenase HmoA
VTGPGWPRAPAAGGAPAGGCRAGRVPLAPWAKATPGNRGAWLLSRPDGEKAEIITLSFWESRQAIQGFAGQDIEKAVFYPEDDRFLVERDLTVHHYEVAAAE